MWGVVDWHWRHQAGDGVTLSRHCKVQDRRHDCRQPLGAPPPFTQDNLEELRRRYRIIVAPATAGAAPRAGSPTPPLGAAPPGFEGLGPGVEGGTAAQLHETSGRLGPV